MRTKKAPNPSEMQHSGIPAGGYRLIPVSSLLQAWLAYRSGEISLRDLRVWFACHEMLARRSHAKGDRKPKFTIEEVHQLVGGVGGQHIRQSITHLTKAGLIQWSESSLTILRPEPTQAKYGVPLKSMLAKVTNHQRRIPVPRRIVRFIGLKGTRALIATILGHMLRCLYLRNGSCNSIGRCKASWIADVFSVDLRSIKAARADLIRNGWLIPGDSSQILKNRYGAAFAINIHWQVGSNYTAPTLSNEHNKTVSPPRTPVTHNQKPTPINNKYLSKKSTNNQYPGSTGLPGVWKGEEREEKPVPRHERVGDSLAVAATRKTPSMSDIRVEDLRDAKRCEALYQDAVRRKLIRNDARHRLEFFTAAAYAQRKATRNPCGLFRTIIQNQLWHHGTAMDEESAQQILAKAGESDDNWMNHLSEVIPSTETNATTAGKSQEFSLILKQLFHD
jgi:hypothetical protein